MDEPTEIRHRVEVSDPTPAVERHVLEVAVPFDHEGTYRLAQLRQLLRALEGAEVPEDVEVYVTLSTPVSWVSWRK